MPAGDSYATAIILDGSASTTWTGLAAVSGLTTYYKITGLEANARYDWTEGTLYGNFWADAGTTFLAHTGFVNGKRNTGGYAEWYMVVTFPDSATYSMGWIDHGLPPAAPYTWATADTLGTASGTVDYTFSEPDLTDRHYKLTATSTDPISFSTDEPDGYIEVYGQDAIEWDDWLDDGWSDGTGAVEEYATIETPVIGTTYHVVAYCSTAGTHTLTWDGGGAVGPPYVVDNNDFASPVAIDTTGPGHIAYDNTGATEVTSPVGYEDDKRSIWFSCNGPSSLQYVRFAATPGIPESAGIATIAVLQEVAGEWTDISISDSGVAKMEPGVAYRVRLSFPTGSQILWDNAGDLAWTMTAVPVNITLDSAAPLGQNLTVTPSAQGAPQDLWYTITSPIPGGLNIVLGDASLAPGLAVSASLYRPDGTLLASIPLRTSAAPEARLVRTVAAGETLKVKVAFSSGVTTPVLLRWGISTDVVWGDWQDSSRVRADNPFDQEPYRQWWVPNSFELETKSWVATQEVITDGEGLTDGHFNSMRAVVDGGGGDTVVSDADDIGYDGWFGWGIDPTDGAYSWNIVTAKVAAARIRVLPFPDEEANGGSSDPFEVLHYPIAAQGAYNGLAGDVAANMETLRGMAVEWEDGEGAIETRVQVSLAGAWSRDVGNAFAGTTHTIADEELAWQLRRSAFDLDDLVDIWPTPGVIAAMSTVHTRPIPADAEGEFQDDFSDEDWVIDVPAEVGDSFTYVMASNTYADGLGVDTNKIIVDYISANGGVVDLTTSPFYHLDGKLSLHHINVGRIYPDYRIGTYVENLDPVLPPAGDLYPGAFLSPTPNIGGQANGVDVNFG